MNSEEIKRFQDVLPAELEIPDSFLLDNPKGITLSELLKLSCRRQDDRFAGKGRATYLARRNMDPTRLPAGQISSIISQQKVSGEHITHILVGRGLIREEDIVMELTTHHGFPYLPLENYEINVDAIRLIPQSVASKHAAIPVDRINNNLMLAMANPFDTAAIGDIEAITRCTVQIFVTTYSDIKKAIGHYYQPKTSLRHDLDDQELV